MATFGDRVKEIRQQKGLSQESLAAMLGTSKQVVSRYETNQRTPKVTVANEYAEALGVELNFLLGEEKPAPQEDGLTSERQAFYDKIIQLDDSQFRMVYNIVDEVLRERDK